MFCKASSSMQQHHRPVVAVSDLPEPTAYGTASGSTATAPASGSHPPTQAVHVTGINLARQSFGNGQDPLNLLIHVAASFLHLCFNDFILRCTMESSNIDKCLLRRQGRRFAWASSAGFIACSAYASHTYRVTLLRGSMAFAKGLQLCRRPHE